MELLKTISLTDLHIILFPIIQIDLGSQAKFKNQDLVL